MDELEAAYLAEVGAVKCVPPGGTGQQSIWLESRPPAAHGQSPDVATSVVSGDCLGLSHEVTLDAET